MQDQSNTLASQIEEKMRILIENNFTDESARQSHFQDLTRLQAELLAERKPLEERIKELEDQMRMFPKRQKTGEDSGRFPLPKTMPESASKINSNSSSKRTYEKSICGSQIAFGSFVGFDVYLKFYLAISLSHTNPTEIKNSTKQLIQENIVTNFPKAGRTTALETPRSTQLARIFQMELGSDTVSCVHQTPIRPLEKEREQTVDIACFLAIHKSDRFSYVAVTVEYKPQKDFDQFQTQCAVYGTDCIQITGRPCITVQIKGEDLQALKIRAFGIVPNPDKRDEANIGPTHRLSLLLHEEGETSLARLFIGLKAYFEACQYQYGQSDQSSQNSDTPHEREVGGCHPKKRLFMMNHVVAIDRKELSVYKAYDYRRRKIDKSLRRRPNLKLVREFIDENAEEFKIGEECSVVKTKFHFRPSGTSWWDPVPCEKVSELLTELKKLHEMGYVHGDIRLNNFILHEGIILDFDFTSEVGSRYLPTLQNISGDGKRADEVSKAIVSGDEAIGNLQMKFEHDIESMRYVLNQLRPEDENKFSMWEQIILKNDIWSMIEPIQHLGCKLEITLQLGSDSPSGTGSPERINQR